MKILLPFFLVFFQGHVTTTKLSTPEKALQWEVTVPASVDEVWAAFTTSEGLSTWLTPGAVTELKKGGEWTAKFAGGATGGGTILEFTPKQELIMSAMAPPMFPNVRKDRTRADWRFTRVDAKHTKIVLVQTGWKQGEEWDRAYAYLADGNAQLLDTLYQRFEKGPIDWSK